MCVAVVHAFGARTVSILCMRGSCDPFLGRLLDWRVPDNVLGMDGESGYHVYRDWLLTWAFLLAANQRTTPQCVLYE